MLDKTIFCYEIHSREDFYTAISDIADDCFGHNLDALHDVLTSAVGVLRFVSFDSMANELGSYAEKIKKVLDDCAKENCELHIEFI